MMTTTLTGSLSTDELTHHYEVLLVSLARTITDVQIVI